MKSCSSEALHVTHENIRIPGVQAKWLRLFLNQIIHFSGVGKLCLKVTLQTVAAKKFPQVDGGTSNHVKPAQTWETRTPINLIGNYIEMITCSPLVIENKVKRPLLIFDHFSLLHFNL